MKKLGWLMMLFGFGLIVPFIYSWNWHLYYTWERYEFPWGLMLLSIVGMIILFTGVAVLRKYDRWEP